MIIDAERFQGVGIFEQLGPTPDYVVLSTIHADSST